MIIKIKRSMLLLEVAANAVLFVKDLAAKLLLWISNNIQDWKLWEILRELNHQLQRTVSQLKPTLR